MKTFDWTCGVHLDNDGYTQVTWYVVNTKGYKICSASSKSMAKRIAAAMNKENKGV